MKNIAMFFPGQGSQYVGMGKSIYEKHESVRKLYAQATEICDIDFKSLCFDGPAKMLNSTEYTQPALVLNSVASYGVFTEETSLRPVAMAGHSIGEISALICAGAMEFVDGIRLARQRGLAMSQCGSSEHLGMAAVLKLDRIEVENICSKHSGFKKSFQVANFNSQAQVVLSGSKSDLAEIEPKLIEAGAKYIALRVSGAFHSLHMEPAVKALESDILKIKFTPSKIPVIANVDAKIHADEKLIGKKLLSQITNPVLWQESIENLKKGFEQVKLSSDKIDVLIDSGPGVVLKKLNSIILPDLQSFSLDHQDDESPLARNLEVDVRTLEHKPPFFGKCMAVAVSTRNTNFDENSYQESVLSPYQKLKDMYDTLEGEERGASLDEVKLGLSLVDKIMQGKGATKREQEQRAREILRSTGFEDVLAEVTS